MIPRCPHHVYSPDGDGEPSVYCTGCYSPSIPLGHRAIDEEEDEELAIPQICPICMEGLVVGEEYDFECLECGFNGI